MYRPNPKQIQIAYIQNALHLLLQLRSFSLLFSCSFNNRNVHRYVVGQSDTHNASRRHHPLLTICLFTFHHFAYLFCCCCCVSGCLCILVKHNFFAMCSTFACLTVFLRFFVLQCIQRLSVSEHMCHSSECSLSRCKCNDYVQ